MISSTYPPAPSKRREHRSSPLLPPADTFLPDADPPTRRYADTSLYSRVPALAPALEDQCRSRIPETALMKSQTRLQKISAGISLVILSLGFSSLGLLSFVNKPHADLANIPQVGTASCIAGTAASLLAGTTFLVASCVYWRRYSQWPV
jgi:hypothetical protein